MKKFLKMCIDRGFVWERPDGWWVAGVAGVDAEPVPPKVAARLDKVWAEWDV